MLFWWFHGDGAWLLWNVEVNKVDELRNVRSEGWVLGSDEDGPFTFLESLFVVDYV